MSAHLFCLKNKGPQVASSGFPKHTYISSGFCTVVFFKQRKPTNRFSSSKDTKKTFTSPRTTFCYVEAGELLFKLSVLKHNGWIFFFFCYGIGTIFHIPATRNLGNQMWVGKVQLCCLEKRKKAGLFLSLPWLFLFPSPSSKMLVT